MPIAQRGTIGTFLNPVGTNVTSVPLTVPTGVVDGDVMVVGAGSMTSPNGSVTPPAGWTQVDSTTSATTLAAGVWYRVASGETAGSTTYTWTVPSGKGIGIIGAWSGVDVTNPVDNSGAAHAVTVKSTASTSSSYPSVTTAATGALALGFGFGRNTANNLTNNSWSTPTGWVETEDLQNSFTNGQVNGVAQMITLSPSVGATASASTTLANSSTTLTFVVALKPAADPTRRGFTTAASGAGTLPTGTLQNDVSYVAISTDSSSVVTPSGWTLLAGPVTITGSTRGYLFRRVEGVAPSGQTFSGTGAGTALIWVSYFNVDTTTPEDVAPSFPSAHSGTSFANTGITTVAANSMIVGGLWTSTPIGGTTITPPGGLTDTTTAQASGDEAELADGLIESAGTSTGTLTWTVASTVAGGVPFLLALRKFGVSAPATIAGVVAAATTAAPAGTVTAATNVTVSGVVAAATTAAPTGTVTGNATLFGAAAAASTVAPVGTITATKNVTLVGAVAAATAVALAGSISGTATIPGVTSAAATTAPAGSVTATRAATINGPVSTAAAAAPNGTVTGTAVITGPTATAFGVAPNGGVDTAGNVTLAGPTAHSTGTAPSGDLALTVDGPAARATAAAPAGISANFVAHGHTPIPQTTVVVTVTGTQTVIQASAQTRAAVTVAGTIATPTSSGQTQAEM